MASRSIPVLWTWFAADGKAIQNCEAVKKPSYSSITVSAELLLSVWDITWRVSRSGDEIASSCFFCLRDLNLDTFQYRNYVGSQFWHAAIEVPIRIHNIFYFSWPSISYSQLIVFYLLSRLNSGIFLELPYVSNYSIDYFFLSCSHLGA
jgi:hypothetical protein